MKPMLNHGEGVLVSRSGKLEIGDVVVARHPYRTRVKIIKRIENIEEDEKFFLVSENPEEGTDSKSFGAIKKDQIVGKVVAVLV